MITNPHALTDITPEVVATMDTGLAALRSGCAELPTADAALLRRAAKMGLKSETFSREALELARQNPHLCPAGLDLEQAEHSMALRDTLLSRYLQARQLAETLEVAMQVCGVDAFDAARTAYKSMKANCRDAALLELIDHLGRSFRSRRAEKPSEPEQAASTNHAAASPEPGASTVAHSNAAPFPRATEASAADRLSEGAAKARRDHPISAPCPGKYPSSKSPKASVWNRAMRRRVYWIKSHAPIRNFPDPIRQRSIQNPTSVHFPIEADRRA
jgi:hypothetical protein